ncbi:MAG: hypothetical protein A4E65_02287 [Syntrophorhabdus sp. PtaU1.Bin153]|jgi:hypothetical protein|nr:MAG: hypothetical protein A4E65_02287 [Syntrophorhabdus sp. PtaU1.Bin153]
MSDTVRGIVINLANQGITTYDHYSFNSLCLFNGKCLGASDQGIFVLDGERDSDAAIDAEIETGITDMGTSLKKRVTDAAISLKADGPYELTMVSDKTYRRSYQVTNDRVNGHHTSKVDCAKGIKARYWGAGFRNTEGSDFELQSVRIITEIVARRV